MSNDASLRQHVISLLKEGNAHATFDDAVKDMPADLRGKVPKGAEHSPWQLLEHLRLAQEDILDFSTNAEYKAKEWPKDYWPEDPEPPDAKAWEGAIHAYQKDLEALCALVEDENTDLFAKIPHGD